MQIRHVLQVFVTAYNNPVHTAHFMAQAAVNDKHVIEICIRLNGRRSHVHVGRLKFDVGEHVRISNDELKIGKGSNRIILARYLESYFFRRTRRPVCEL